jgi:hypothetical protein
MQLKIFPLVETIIKSCKLSINVTHLVYTPSTLFFYLDPLQIHPSTGALHQIKFLAAPQTVS